MEVRARVGAVLRRDWRLPAVSSRPDPPRCQPPSLPPPLRPAACPAASPPPQVAHRYVKQRRQFGRHPQFTDHGAEVRAQLAAWCASRAAHRSQAKQPLPPPHVLQLLLDLRPNEEHAQAWTVKPQTCAAVQAAPDMSEHEVRRDGRRQLLLPCHLSWSSSRSSSHCSHPSCR